MRAARVWLVVAAMLAASACNRGARCATCGMKIDPASAWVGYVTVGGKELAFDTPRCAFDAWRHAAGSATGARFREYYSQEMKPTDALRFKTKCSPDGISSARMAIGKG